MLLWRFWCRPIFGPQLTAKIGDLYRFHFRKVLVAFAGIDNPPHHSGQMTVHSRCISMRGSLVLRRTLFLVMTVVPQNSPANYRVYMVDSAEI